MFLFCIVLCCNISLARYAMYMRVGLYISLYIYRHVKQRVVTRQFWDGERGNGHLVLTFAQSVSESAVSGGHSSFGHLTVTTETVIEIRYSIPSTANHSGAVIGTALGDI